VRQQHWNDRGAVTALVAVVAIGLIFVAGLAYDGGSILTAHATARSHAAKAARTGAQEIDLDVLRSSGEVTLDPSAARAAASGYLAAVGSAGTVSVDGDTVTVTVTITQEMRILPLPDRRVTSTESATAVGENSLEVSP
jgi:hypothetical protein